MARFRRPIALAVGVVSLTAVGLGPVAFTSGVASASVVLKVFRWRAHARIVRVALYPETGNGGYGSVHTTCTWSTTRARTPSCRATSRADQSGDAVPDELQPGLRTELREH